LMQRLLNAMRVTKGSWLVVVDFHEIYSYLKRKEFFFYLQD
jgi:hypothetical protein